jgi:chromosome segregation ATPase
MEQEQIEKRLEWLDETRRKDADAISRLMERMSNIEESVNKQVHQGQDMSEELTRLKALAARINQFDDTLVQHRKEVSKQLKDAEERRTKKEKDIEKIRRADLKENANTIDEIRLQLQDLGKIDERAQERKQEEIRISKELDNFRRELDDFIANDDLRSRSIASMEEGRKQDAKRIADVQSEISNVRKGSHEIRGEFDSILDRVRRIEVQISELKASEDEQQEAQKIWAEQQNLKQAEFERVWKEKEKKFDEYIKRGGELDERLLAFEVAYQNLKQVKDDLDKALDRLERRINEVTEMHRINTDRSKQEWSAFQADDQKRWNTYKLTTDEQWREHSRLHDKITAQLDLLEENSTEALRLLNMMRENDLERLTHMMTMLREWAAESKE